MKKSRTIFDFAVQIQHHGGILDIRCPDLDVDFSELKHPTFLAQEKRKDYYKYLGVAVLKTYQKMQEQVHELEKKGLEPPTPTLVPGFHRSKNEKLVSPIKVAELKGCHKDTVRRAIDRGELKCLLTPGGHRKVALSEAQRWIQRVENRERGRPKGS